MRAAWYTKLGSAGDVLEVGERETPVPGPGEVRVRVRTSGINPVDVKRRAGGRGVLDSTLVVPHFDGAGVIDQVGDGVDAGRLGNRVWIYEAQWGSDLGTAAEFATVPESRAVHLPANATFMDGACLGIPALTAHRCVYADGPVEGQTVLVTGGAGAVGAYAVQCARLGGARVLSTVSADEKVRIARAAGADVVINYREEDVPARVAELTEGEGVDRIVEVEMGGNLDASIAMLKDNGVISAYASEGEPQPAVPFYTLLYKNLTVRFELVFLMPEEAKQKAVEDLTKWLTEGEMRHTVAERFALENIVAAHEAVESGPLGKVLIDLGI
ncbi:MAG: NADPH:quinone reductase [Gemmatimonadales bacterium]|nr:NADPH:quinone reductase [Gemmatimonadales bacterium]MYG18364.1 NADPH:quinone reductase [Gemmatimonadales bacterium]MYH08841.1 NADPH:quinone reductase [Gemmatimonadales bacterium]MYL06870.1 NADPH:quinone reductase [Gemmatimonadales bacterium]